MATPEQEEQIRRIEQKRKRLEEFQGKGNLDNRPPLVGRDRPSALDTLEKVGKRALPDMLGLDNEVTKRVGQLEQLRQQLPVQRRQGSAGVALREGRNRLIDSTLNIPGATGEFIAGGAGLLQTLNPFQDDPDRTFFQEVGDRFQEQREVGPAKALRNLQGVIDRNIGGSEDVLSFVKAARDFVGGGEHLGAFSENRERTRNEMLETTLTNEEDFPAATMIGRGLADVAVLLAVRAPFAKKNVAANTAAKFQRGDRAAFIGKELAKRGVEEGSPLAFLPTAFRAIKQELPKGMVRAVEAGSEAGFLAALQRDMEIDPGSAMAFGAGTQAVGSALLFPGSSIGRTANQKMVGWGLIGTAIVEGVATFGFSDKTVSENLQDLASKYGAIAALGASAWVAGLNRPGGNVGDIANISPLLGEIITGSRRGAFWQAGITAARALKDGDPDLYKSMKVIGSNPESLPEPFLKRLRAAGKRGPKALNTEVERLLKNDAFRRLIDEKFRALEQEPPEEVPISGLPSQAPV